MSFRVRLSRCLLLSVAVASPFLAVPGAQADSGRGRHKQFYVVPAAVAVTIDGRLDDWDLSGQIEMFVVEGTRAAQHAKIAAMYDAEAFYLSGEIADASPLMNRHDPKVNPGRAWDADAVQFRLTLDPSVGYPVRESSFDYRGENAVKDTREDIVHLLLWHYTDDGAANLQMQKGMSYRNPDPGWQPDGLVPADRFQAVYHKWDAGDGYNFEYRIPWSTLGAAGPPAPGSTVAGTVNVTWSRPDGLAHIRMQGAAYDIMGEPGFSFQNTACWGRVIFAEKGHVPRDLVEAGVPPERQTPLEFGYELPTAGEVTLQLERPDGTVVRILEAQQARQAGRHTVAWDGLDYQRRILPAGDYRWRGIVATEPVHAEFRFSVHNSGRLPYTTDDGKGGWGGDHGTPQDMAALADGMLLVWDSAEYGSGTIRVDLEGRKLWGTQSGATHIATDGKYYYTVGDRGFHRGLNVSICEVENARPARLPNGVATFAPPPGGSDGSNRASGLAWHDGRLYVSYRDRNLIAVFSTVAGTLVRTLELPAPERLAVTPDGTVLAVSEGKVVSVQCSGFSVQENTRQQHEGDARPPDRTLNTEHRTLIANRLDSSQGIAVGGDGLIYVANGGALQNVSVFDKDGKYLRSVGKAGGRPRVGAYDRQGMLEPGGIALDARGRLWVAETLDGPKRISVWDTMTGENLDEFFGPAGCFAYGCIDPDRPEEILAHHVLWEIDWRNCTTRPKATIWRATAPNMMMAPGPYAYQNTPRLVTADNGVQYMWGNTVPVSVLMRREGDLFKPVAALLDNNGSTGIELLDKDDKTYPRDRRLQPHYLWQDANDDQVVQADELTLLPREYGRARFALVNKDLSVRLSSGKLWRPVRIEANGRPVYDPARAESVPVGTPLADGSVLNLDQRGGRDGTQPGPGLYRQRVDGTMAWQYPDMIAWRHSLNLPMVKAGRLWAMTGLMGVAGEFFAHQTYWGPNQVFRTDGQYVGTILFDRREVGRGPYAGQSEGQGGYFTQLRLDGRDRCFAIGGSQDVRVWEVVGLDSIRDLPGGAYVHTADAVAKAQAAKDAYEAVLAGGRHVRIVPGGKAALATAPPARRPVEGGRGFEVRAAYDAEGLYLRFDVTTPHELVNATPDRRILFRGGNCLDIQLASDPAAAPTRDKPVPGDLRLLVTRQNRQPLAMLFRPRIADFAGEAIVLNSPTGQEAFDAIEAVTGVALDYARTGEGFTATVTVPHSVTGLAPRPGQPIQLDLGYIFGNAEGTRTAARAYLFNDSFSAHVIDDIPNESRLEPACWGEATVD